MNPISNFTIQFLRNKSIGLNEKYRKKKSIVTKADDEPFICDVCSIERWDFYYISKDHWKFSFSFSFFWLDFRMDHDLQDLIK